MNEIARLNDRPAPMRRDLRGEDAAYELKLLLNKLEVEDTLRISRCALHDMRLEVSYMLSQPTYPHETWEDLGSDEICIKRIG